MNGFNAVFFVLPLLAILTVNVSAETTFFDQDDAFIMSSSNTQIGGVTGGTGGGGGGGSGESCKYKWNCTNWNECLQSGKQTRNCTNIGTCPGTYKSPEINQNCTYTAPKVEEDKKLETENIAEKETAKQNKTEKISGKEIVNNKLFIYFIIVLIISFIIFYFKKLYKNLFRGGLISKLMSKKEGQERINISIDYITSLINKKVYTDNGIYIGNVVNVIIGANRIDSIKIDIKNEKYKLDKIKGCIIHIQNIQCFGEIIIVDKEVINGLMKKLIKKVIYS